MEENKVLNEVDEVDETSGMNNDELKEAINTTLERIRNQSMVLGYSTACMTIMQMIAPWRNPHASHNDYKRIFKKVEEFCGKVLKQPKEEATEETAQN